MTLIGRIADDGRTVHMPVGARWWWLSNVHAAPVIPEYEIVQMPCMAIHELRFDAVLRQFGEQSVGFGLV